MSASVETMFSVREVPWHGLGKIVENAPTSKDAIWMAGLDWEVLSKDVYDENGVAVDGYKRNVRSSDNTTLGIVTERYKIVQNSEAFQFTDSLLEEGITYETAGSLKNGKTIWLLAKMPEQKILDDKFDPYICFTNSHDGKGAISVCLTPIRVVCNNTLNLALSTARRSWTTKHMGDMQSKLSEAKHTLGLANKYMANLDIEADKLANLKVSDAELETIFNAMFPIDYVNDTPRKINNINELKQNLYKCYEAPDLKQFKGTAWGIVNAVTDLVAHTAPTRLTKNYAENNFAKIIDGHPFVDNVYNSLLKFKGVA